MTVPTIGIREVYVPNVYVPNWLNSTPNVDHLVPPVVLYIGNPIINMPGCVKGHQDNQMHKSGLPKDKNLVEQDPNKAMIPVSYTHLRAHETEADVVLVNPPGTLPDHKHTITPTPSSSSQNLKEITLSIGDID